MTMLKNVPLENPQKGKRHAPIISYSFFGLIGQNLTRKILVSRARSAAERIFTLDTRGELSKI